ncbi:hypothetical protein [Bartonella apihabitans]|uniref:hypothetical protein n=1 Tax=Bartonella apihabitans TaxID=2750929 RepID=UPI003BB524FA
MRKPSSTLGGLYLYFKSAIPCYSSVFPALDQTSEQLVLGVDDGKTVAETPKVGETLNF